MLSCFRSPQASVIEDIIRFAHKRKLILFADEVYQTNIYGKVPFVSFKVRLPPLIHLAIVTVGKRDVCWLRRKYCWECLWSLRTSS